MAENYQLNKTLDSMRRDSVVGRSLGLEKKQNLVRNIMEKQGISTDPNKLKGYQKEKFLKAINNETDLGFYDKKAFRSAYGDKKPKNAEAIIRNEKKPTEKSGTHNENLNIQNKNIKLRTENSKLDEKKSKVLDFSESNKGIRKADPLFHRKDHANHNQDEILQKDNRVNNENESVKNRLRDIQS